MCKRKTIRVKSSKVIYRLHEGPTTSMDGPGPAKSLHSLPQILEMTAALVHADERTVQEINSQDFSEQNRMVLALSRLWIFYLLDEIKLILVKMYGNCLLGQSHTSPRGKFTVHGNSALGELWCI